VPNFSLNFSVSIVVFIVLGLIAIAFAFWSYRETVPPSTKLKRNFLATLRSAALIVILFIVFEPIVGLLYREIELPIIAILIDDSESMAISDKGGDRKTETMAILTTPVLAKAEQRRFEYFRFSDQVASVPVEEVDSLKFSGALTDISESFEYVKRKMIGQNLAAVILVSDGQYNVGINPVGPAGFLGVPVFAVGVGSPAEQRDISVIQVIANEIAYVDNTIPADVRLTAFGFKNKRIIVQLAQDTKILQSKTVEISEDGAVVTIPFEFKASAEGLEKFVVTAIPQEGELTDKNNSKTFFVKILKSKRNILLVSGSPGSDHSFLYKNLVEDPNNIVQALIEKKDGTFLQVNPDGAPKDFDCFVFDNYPTARSDNQPLQAWVSQIVANHKPWLLFYGPQLDLNKFQTLKGASAVELKSEGQDELSVAIALSLNGKNSSVTKLSENPQETAQLWSELPPVWVSRVSVVPTDNSEILARADYSKSGSVSRFRKDLPLIVSRKNGKDKSIAVMAYGLWKTQFILTGLNRTNQAYPTFTKNALSWLTTQEDSKPVIIVPSKKVYRNGEKILFSAQVYDDQFRAVSDATVKMKILSKNATVDLQLNSLGSGRYEAVCNGLDVGDYSFEGEAYRNEISLGKDKGRFVVENYSIELVNTAMNEKLLRGIGAESGGQYFSSENFGEIGKYLNFQTVSYDRKEEIELWNKMVLLFILTGLLSVEWFVRKRSDML